MLSPRHEEILTAVIRAHVQRGEPVGSRTLNQGGLTLSPASIRNAMAELEAMGLLSQPHASAGRVPTDAGFRYYADHLREETPIPESEQARIREACAQGETLEETLTAVGTVLASLTDCASLVLPPKLEEAILERIQFLPMSGTRVLVLLVTASGQLLNRVIALPEGLRARELEGFGKELSRRMGGLTLARAREILLKELKSGQRDYYILRRKLLETIFLRAARADGLIIDGSANLLGFPELSGVGRLREVLAAIEGKRKLIRLLDRCLEEEGVRWFIGSASPNAMVEGCSVVASPFTGPEGRSRGSLGLLGPTRLDYAHLIPLVGYTARILSGRFAGGTG